MVSEIKGAIYNPIHRSNGLRIEIETCKIRLGISSISLCDLYVTIYLDATSRAEIVFAMDEYKES